MKPKLHKTILALLSVLAICLCSLVILVVVGNLFLSSDIQPTSSDESLPPHIVNDLRDNPRIQNFNAVYFIVADKSLSEQDGKTIVEYYMKKLKDYEIVNIYIFCDSTYADYEHYAEFEMAIESADSAYWTHLLYWYYRWSGTDLQTGFVTRSTSDVPIFGDACK
jgi:hypothetical protein